MVDIFDYYSSPEMPFLEELAEELEGTFCVIAYTDQGKNREYIRDQQKYFFDKYDRFLNHVDTAVGMYHIVPAYDIFENLLDGDPTDNQLVEMCEEGIYVHLIRGNPQDNCEGIFQEFYDKMGLDPVEILS